MNSNILSEKENALFRRKEVLLEVENNSTPNVSDAEKFVSEKFSTTPEKVKVKKIHSKFGSNKFDVLAFVYDSEEDKNRIEPKIKEKKKK